MSEEEINEIVLQIFSYGDNQKTGFWKGPDIQRLFEVFGEKLERDEAEKCLEVMSSMQNKVLCIDEVNTFVKNIIKNQNWQIHATNLQSNI